MKWAWLTLRPQEPLVLGEVRVGAHVLTTLPYIPGRVARGAWADWLLARGEGDGLAATMEDVRIGNFFPAPEWRPVRYASPFLMSALTCKEKPGFRAESRPSRESHGVVDTLIPHLAYELLRTEGARFPVPFAITCQRCGGRMEPVPGFYVVYQDDRAGPRYAGVRPRYHAQTKVGLDRGRRTAAEGVLYNVTALSPWVDAPDGHGGTAQLQFVGRVRGPAEKVDDLIDALNAVPLGALRSRGYGRVRAERREGDFPSVAERLRRFNDRLVEMWSDLRRLTVSADALPDRPRGTYFSVDLLAPGVFRRQGLPALVPALSVDGVLLEPVFWLTRPGFAGGWSIAWGLPKPTDLAARAGSVYVFRWDGPVDALVGALEEIEQHGVGERRDEGFGECLVCHPWHEEVQER